ncbi:hypothetical protein F0L74_07085 [Chitinophaga agrisoli]|uniref:Uncharacterized protein n=1 Tax=Chitinophaga agrisoli TaxID=2607653 RepID=A0A5B2W4S5_9BACT|nr:hypothetical protein [Chitinophaga agrisoli]KAA2245710.1 hypothetical protein F0L74_07085 [Chitinophaga agrisoli]
MKNFLLTPAEQQVAFDASWIYRKNSVIEKVMELLGALHQQLEQHNNTRHFNFPAACLQRGAKISKGERYKELPWVMLDYPRFFSQEEVFAFRTMFWWGHYFSCTLHLAGAVKEQYAIALIQGYTQLARSGFQVYVQEDPWQHDFEDGNYRAVETFTVQEWRQLVLQQRFIKLAKPFALDIWENIIPQVVAEYAILLEVLGK